MNPRLRALVYRGCQLAFVLGLAGALLGFTRFNVVIGAIKQPVLALGLAFAYTLFALGKLLDALLSPPPEPSRKRKAPPPIALEERMVPPWYFWAALAAYFGWFLLGWTLSPYPHHARAQLANWSLYLGCLFGVGLFFPKVHERNRLLAVFLVIAVVQAVYAFFQFFNLDVVERPTFDFGVRFRGEVLRRVTGSLGNPGYLGGYLAGCLALGAGFLFAMPEGRARNARLVWLAGLAVLLAMVLTFSRSALLALAVSMAALALYGIIHRRQHPGLFRRVLPFTPWLRWTLVALGCVVVVAVGLHERDLSQRIIERLSGRGSAAMLEGRKIMYEANLRMIAAHPVLGLGPGNYISFFRDYRDTSFTAVHDPSREVNEYAHSEFMQQAVELGLPGLLFYVLFLGTILVPALGRLRREPPDRASFILLGTTVAVVSGLAANLADVLLQQLSYSCFMWTLLGWIAATLWTRPRPAPVRGLAFLLVVPVAVWSTSVAVRDYLSDALHYQALRAARPADGRPADLQGALAAAQRAVKLSPYSRSARYFLGALYYSTNRFAEARDLYRELLATDGRFADVVYNLGTCHFFLGEYGEAERLYRQAIRDFPGKADYHFQLGTTLWLCGRIEEATPCYEQAAELYRKRAAETGLAAEDYEHLATCYLRLGDGARALSVYQEKLRRDGGMADTYFMIAAVQMDGGDYAAAAGAFERAAAALRTQTGNRIPLYQTLHHLGHCYLLLGRTAEARETLASALRAAPPDYPRRAELERLLAAAQP
ncbi:tetratricopeptide repeat protein [bacterium]|nr:tetratricopeptide repeat protein [bacterium]